MQDFLSSPQFVRIRQQYPHPQYPLSDPVVFHDKFLTSSKDDPDKSSIAESSDDLLLDVSGLLPLAIEWA